ncbi:exported hypothetical protein [Erythrobacter sp. EC-HK427]|nr:exported hypothetical protein [Erythrobacter sp. EC-HK427]
MARDSSANFRPTQVLSLSAFACASASFTIAWATSGGIGALATGATGPLAGAGFVASWLPFLPTAGAIGALSTTADPHNGQTSFPSSRCCAKSSDEPNQPSNRWPASQERSNTIMAAAI